MTFIRNLLHPAGIVGMLLAIGIPFFIYLAPHIGLKSFLAFGDTQFTFWLFLIQLSAGFVLFFSLFKDFRSWVKNQIPPKSFLILIGIFALALTIFAATQIDAKHRVQSDESIFLSIAQNFYHSQTSATCNQGIFENGHFNCLQNTHTFKTKGLSFLYFLGMPFLGSDLHWIFNFHLVLLFFTIIIFFFALKAWTGSPFFSAIATFLLALQPTLLFQFRAMSVEPLYVFLLALTLLCWKWVQDKNTWRHWILFALLLAFFAQTRQETVFCFLAFILFSLPKLLNQKDFKAPLFFLTLSLFTIPVLFTISYFQGYSFQGGEFSAHGHFIENITRNFEVMTKALDAKGLLVNPFLSYFNYLALTGFIIFIVWIIKDLLQKKIEKPFLYFLFLLLYHIQAYAIFENVSGDFTIEINQRYALVIFPLMAFLAAIPIFLLFKKVFYDLIFIPKAKKYSFLQKFNSTKIQMIAALVIAIPLTAHTMSYRESFNQNIMYKRNHLTTEQVEIMKWLAIQNNDTPRLFVYSRPYHFIGYGYSSLHYTHIRSMKDDTLAKLLDQFNGNVYYLRGLDCWDSKTYHKKAVERRIPTTCDVFEKENSLEPVYKKKILNSYLLEISKLKKRKEYKPEDVLSHISIDFLSQTQNKTGIIIRAFRNYGKKVPWKMSVFLNETELISENPYKPSFTSDTISHVSPLSGFNLFRFIVQDTLSGDTIINQIYDSFFDDDATVIPLTKLSVSSSKQDWGMLQKNKSIENNPLTIGGVRYSNGLGTHTNSVIQFNVNKKYKNFSTKIGLDDESLCSDGFHFKVRGDGALLYESPLLLPYQTHALSVSIENVQTLTLISDKAGSMDCDHVDIVHPVLTQQ